MGSIKRVAQIIGNNRDRIQCLIFVNPDVNALRVTVYEAHTDFVQQRYKKITYLMPNWRIFTVKKLRPSEKDWETL